MLKVALPWRYDLRLGFQGILHRAPALKAFTWWLATCDARPRNTYRGMIHLNPMQREVYLLEDCPLQECKAEQDKYLQKEGFYLL